MHQLTIQNTTYLGITTAIILAILDSIISVKENITKPAKEGVVTKPVERQENMELMETEDMAIIVKA